MRYDQLDTDKIAHSSDLVSILDIEMRILKWNLSNELRSGISEGHASGKYLTELFPFIKGDYRLNCLSDAAKEGKSFYFANLAFEYSDGFYSQLILPLKDHTNNRIGVLNIVKCQNNDQENHTRKSLLLPLLKDEAMAIELLL
jgi:PAS domain-containing protein